LARASANESKRPQGATEGRNPNALWPAGAANPSLEATEQATGMPVLARRADSRSNDHENREPIRRRALCLAHLRECDPARGRARLMPQTSAGPVGVGP